MIKSRSMLVDKMRGKWEHRIPSRMIALYSYVEGFADCYGFDLDDYWDNARLYFQQYMGLSKKSLIPEFWIGELEKAAPVPQCEISIFYAALDGASDIKPNTQKIWVPDDDWCERYSENQKNASFQPIPAPNTIYMELFGSGVSRLIFANVNNLRYYEITMPDEKRLVNWAQSCLHINSEAWI